MLVVWARNFGGGRDEETKKEETYIIKLFPQLLQVDNATPLALNEVGKTSAGKAHGTGPHVAPKASM